MTDKDRQEIVWRLAQLAADRCAMTYFGEGKGMIGAGRGDGEVSITFYAENGDELPKVIGAIVSSEEQPDEKANKVRPVSAAVFKNRESLLVLKSIVDKGLSYFDEMETK